MAARPVIANKDVPRGSVHLPMFVEGNGPLYVCPIATASEYRNDGFSVNAEDDYRPERIAAGQACSWCLEHRPPPRLVLV